MNFEDGYLQILKFTGNHVDEAGVIYSSFTNEPVKIGDKVLVMPTQDQLRTDADKKVYFHPMAENMLRGESDIVAYLRKSINFKINASLSLLFSHLTNLAMNAGDLTNKKLELVSGISVSTDSIAKINALLIAIHKNKKIDALAHIRLSKNAKVNGETYLRTGDISFEVYESIRSDPAFVEAYKLKPKHIETIKTLYEAILPKLADGEKYATGTNVKTAPYLKALLDTAKLITKELNAVAKLIKSELGDDYAMAHFETALPDLDELHAATRSLPSFREAAGSGKIEEEQREANKAQPQRFDLSSQISSSAANLTNNTSTQMPTTSLPTPNVVSMMTTPAPTTTIPQIQQVLHPQNSDPMDAIKMALNGGMPPQAPAMLYPPMMQNPGMQMQPNPFTPQFQPTPMMMNPGMGMQPNPFPTPGFNYQPVPMMQSNPFFS